MMLINCKGLQKSCGAETILSDVTFIIEEKEKAAVVGVNGAGKTTLLKILNNEIPSDGGTISMAKQIRIGYLPQTAELNSDNGIYQELLLVFSGLIRLEREIRDLETRMADLSGDLLEAAMSEYAERTHLFEEQDGYAYNSRVRGVIKGLGFSQSEWDQPIAQLSGGQKTRVALGKLLLAAPDLLLLDEPTNHLDIESIAWLEDYLKGYDGAVLIISHDRYFLDRVVGKIIEIENQKSKVYMGNYSFYARHKETDRAVLLKSYLDQQREIKRQEEVIARLRSFNREKSIKQAESKEKRLDMMEKIDRPESMPDKMRLLLTPKLESGGDVLDVEDAGKTFDGQVLFGNVSFSLKKGDKAALIGPNGIGKTTLFRMIMEEIPMNQGRIRRGVNVRIGYYAQEHEGLSGTKSIMDEISDAYPTLTNAVIRNVLAAFVFTGDDVFKPISALSGGEKGRVALAKIMLGGANFLVLDEPTNHLDMISKEILEEALRDFPGTVLYISHDRYFINHTADTILEMSKDGLTIYRGNYDFYLEKKRQASEGLPDPGREVWKKKKGGISEDKRKKNLTEKLERQIQETESRIEEFSKMLLLEEVGRDATLADQYYTQKTELETHLLGLYEQWSVLSEESME